MNDIVVTGLGQLPFVPSHSSLDAFQQCPMNYWGKYVSKESPYIPSEHTDLGKLIHILGEWWVRDAIDPSSDMLNCGLDGALDEDTFEAAKRKAQTTFRMNFADVAGHYAHLRDFLSSVPWKAFTTVRVERKIAFNHDLVGCDYFSRDGVLRSVVDLYCANSDTAFLADYKSSAIKNFKETEQLARNALVTLLGNPDLKAVHTAFVSTRGVKPIANKYTRADIMPLLNRLKAVRLELAGSYATGKWPMITSGLCKAHCGTLSCPNNGKR